MAEYIQLADSNGTIDKRFYAVGYKPKMDRRRNVERLSDGLMSVVGGKSVKIFNYDLVVEETSSDANFGSLSDLETLFRLSNPGGSPTDVITLTHVDGEEYEVRFLNDLEWKNEGVLISGQGAWLKVKAILVDVSTVELDFSAAAQSGLIVVV